MDINTKNGSTVFNIGDLSNCAKSCIATACDLADTRCICSSYTPTADICALDTCSLQESLYTRVFIETSCHTPVRNRSITFNVMILVFGGITAAILCIRLAYKQFFSKKKRLELQDWTILFAAIVGICSIGFTIGGLTAHGLGRDIWGVSQTELRLFSIYFYLIQALYILLITLIKLSLCFFYLNIFVTKITRVILWGTVAYFVAGATAFIIGIILQCDPISYQWDKYDFSNGPVLSGHCININAAGWSNAALNVVSDFWLLGLPIYEIKNLSLSWKRKAGVGLMFMTGACITVISFLRLQSIIKYARSSNPTWDQWDIVWWSTIEVLVGFICTSLPTLRLLLVQIAPKVFGSDYSANRYAYTSLSLLLQFGILSLPPLKSATALESFVANTNTVAAQTNRKYRPRQQQELHRLSSSQPDESLDRSSSSKAFNTDSHLIVDTERGEIRTQPLGEPGFYRTAPLPKEKPVPCAKLK